MESVRVNFHVPSGRLAKVGGILIDKKLVAHSRNLARLNVGHSTNLFLASNHRQIMSLKVFGSSTPYIVK